MRNVFLWPIVPLTIAVYGVAARAAETKNGTWVCAQPDSSSKAGVKIGSYHLEGDKIVAVGERDFWKRYGVDVQFDPYIVLRNDSIGLIAIRPQTWTDLPSKRRSVSLETIQIDTETGTFITVSSEVDKYDVSEPKTGKGTCSFHGD